MLESKMIYLIIKEGNYRHCIAGAFLDPEVARWKAKTLADTCVDSHHSYVVQPMPIDELLESSMEWYGHVFNEPEELVSFKKGDING